MQYQQGYAQPGMMQQGYVMGAPQMMAPQQGYMMGAPQMMAAFSPYQAGWQPQNPTAYALFIAVDADRSGSISFNELQTALSNGGWTKFSAKTTRLLIKMFDSDRSGAPGTLGYLEFEKLWAQLTNWRAWFDNADRDRSGKLNFLEVAQSLRQFGFNLPEPAMRLVFNAYDEDASGNVGFDEYIQVLAELNALTSMFRRFDTTGSGVATLDYNSFMSIVYATRS